METINKISQTRIEIVETKEEKKEYEKATLEAMKESHLSEVARIDTLLLNFN